MNTAFGHVSDIVVMLRRKGIERKQDAYQTELEAGLRPYSIQVAKGRFSDVLWKHPPVPGTQIAFLVVVHLIKVDLLSLNRNKVDIGHTSEKPPTHRRFNPIHGLAPYRLFDV